MVTEADRNPVTHTLTRIRTYVNTYRKEEKEKRMKGVEIKKR